MESCSMQIQNFAKCPNEAEKSVKVYQGMPPQPFCKSCAKKLENAGFTVADLTKPE